MTRSSRKTTTRRRLLGTATMAGVSGAMSTQALLASNGAGTIPSRVVLQDEVAPLTGDMPVWTVVVHLYEDPYRGTVTQPQQLDPSKRYLGADVEIQNNSDRPLSVAASHFRLRAADGVDHAGSGVVGSDPRLFDVNMLPGERVRGWIYFAVPSDAAIASLIYIPPAPQVVIPVPAPGGPPDEGDGTST